MSMYQFWPIQQMNRYSQGWTLLHLTLIHSTNVRHGFESHSWRHKLRENNRIRKSHFCNDKHSQNDLLDITV